MGYKVSHDADNDIIVVQIDGIYTSDDARAFTADVERLLQGMPYRQIMVDLGEAGKLEGTQARRITAERLRDLNVTHIAMANVRPAARSMGKILMHLAGGGVKSDFFATTEQATNWLLSQRGEGSS
jgi:hypothetical protein